MEKTILYCLTKQLIYELTHKKMLNYSLLGGDFGKLIYLYHAQKEGYCDRNTVDGLMDKVLRSVKQCPIITTYCNGLSGFSVGLKILEDEGFLEGISTSIGVYSDILSTTLNSKLITDLDFLHGAIGIGLYFVMMTEFYEEAHVFVLKIIEELERLAILDSNGGIFWLYPNRYGKYVSNLSMSHGICSTAMFIAKALNVMKNEDDSMRCKKLLSGIGRYLVSNLKEPQIMGSYTPMLPYDLKSRLGWCYGDIGTSIVLRTIGEVINESSYFNLSREISIYTSSYRNNMKLDYVNDACLCHGASGIAHYFYNCFESYGEEIFLKAYKKWINIAVSMHEIINGKCRFGSFKYTDNKIHECTNLLEGDAGVGLLILGCHDTIDKLLLFK